MSLRESMVATALARAVKFEAEGFTNGVDVAMNVAMWWDAMTDEQAVIAADEKRKRDRERRGTMYGWRGEAT